MKILICYASTEGQTRKICRFAADTLAARGHGVELLPADASGDPAPTGVEAAILAGSVHAGALQKSLAEFARDNADWLNRVPTLFLQVSLAAAGDDADDRAELDRIARDFCAETGFDPGAIHHIAGAFRFTQYDFFKSWAMRWIAYRRGQDVDPHADREYTDWDGLERLLAGWPA